MRALRRLSTQQAARGPGRLAREQEGVEGDRVSAPDRNLRGFARLTDVTQDARHGPTPGHECDASHLSPALQAGQWENLEEPGDKHGP